MTDSCDGYLATIRETFRVLESRGQAPDDNAPLSVTVRRVLDYLDGVTAQRDALNARVELLEAQARGHEHVAAQLATLKKQHAEMDAMRRNDALDGHAALEERDNLILDLQAQLAALKKRIADAPRRRFRTDTIEHPARKAWFALVRLEDGET